MIWLYFVCVYQKYDKSKPPGPVYVDLFENMAFEYHQVDII